MDKKQRILITIDDLLADFIYYDRKEDEDLPRGEIEQAVKSGQITTDEMIDRFASALRASCGG